MCVATEVGSWSSLAALISGREEQRKRRSANRKFDLFHRRYRVEKDLEFYGNPVNRERRHCQIGKVAWKSDDNALPLPK